MTVGVGPGPDGVAVGLGDVWVASSIDGTVMRIDPIPERTSPPSTSKVGRRTSSSVRRRLGHESHVVNVRALPCRWPC